MELKKAQLKELRKLFRDGVLERDNYCCKFCDIKENLDAHHITDRHEMFCDGYAISNGITLCPKHHLMAEQYHIDKNTCSKDFLPEELYKKIESSYEKALEDCEKLENTK